MNIRGAPPASMVTRNFYFVILGGALAFVPALAMVRNFPGPLSPYPIGFMLPLWLLGPSGYVSFLLLPMAFWIWSHQLGKGDGGIPRRSGVLLLVFVVLSLIWTIGGYEVARTWQGLLYARLLVAVDLGVPALLAGVLRQSRGRQTWVVSLVFHWLLFAWLGSYAFVYMGELP